MFWQWRREKLLASPKRLGRWGERQAEKFLRKKGFTILDRNFSCPMGEIDIIAAPDSGGIVFVEVKTRASEDFNPVENTVTGAKEQRMLKAARAFLAVRKIAGRPCRFDFIGIVAAEDKPQIRHYKGAFSPYLH